MKVLTSLLLASFVLFTAACGGDPAPDAPPQDAGTAGDVQVFEIEAGQMGYSPKEVTLEAGQPARLVFTRTVESECSSQVQIPAFGIDATDLPLGEPVAIEFTPDEGGTFTFICGMDMQRGTIVVES